MAAAHNNDLEDYFKERDTIEQSDSHSDDDELSKTPDGEFRLLTPLKYLPTHIFF